MRNQLETDQPPNGVNCCSGRELAAYRSRSVYLPMPQGVHVAPLPRYRLRKVRRRGHSTYFNQDGADEVVMYSNVPSESGKYMMSGSSSPDIGLSPSPVKQPARDSNLTKLSEVKLTSDPFKTGKKHFYNMLRPTIYSKSSRRKELTASDIRFIDINLNKNKRIIEKRKSILDGTFRDTFKMSPSVSRDQKELAIYLGQVHAAGSHESSYS